VKIAPPEQLAIGSLVFTLQNTKRWIIHWNKIAQIDFGKVEFIGKQDDKGGFDLTEYQEKLTTAPKSVSVDIQVQDMPHHAKFVYGAGLFAGKPPRSSAGRYTDFFTYVLTSDGVFSHFEWDNAADSFTILSETQVSLITSGTNYLSPGSCSQEPWGSSQ
jgi:hypothetical protein